MEKEIYEMRVVPFVKYVARMKNKKKYEDVVDNLTYDEITNMSSEPRMFRRNHEGLYISEMPLTFKGGTGIRGFLCYVFDELNEEEQAKYLDRSIVIPTTSETVVMVYGESSKKFFGKIRTKKDKK